MFLFDLAKVFFASLIFSAVLSWKKSLARPKTSSWEKVKGALTRYAKPVVAKTSWSSSLRAWRASGEGFLKERADKSTMGRLEKEVVIFEI